jgi:multidrug efflux pump
MQVAYDSTKFIQASIDEVKWSLGQAVVIVIAVIFLFLGNFRSVLIPVVTIPLSLIGAGMIMSAVGFSLNLLTLLAMVLAIGLVVDDAIVVVENVYRHIEEGKSPPQAALIGAREIAGPVISMTLTLAAVYAPIGFLGGVTGTLFREFAFTLAGAVIISGVVAVTLSPMMCSILLKHGGAESRFARLLDRGFSRLADGYGRRLERSLDYRPVTALFGAAILIALAFMYLHTKAELAPEEDQGVLFALTKAPQYSNLDYQEVYGEQLDKALSSFPESDLRFILTGRFGPSQGIAGMILKPWSERTRSALQIKPLLQQKMSAVEGMNAFVFSLPPLPASIGGLPVQMVIDSTGDFVSL